MKDTLICRICLKTFATEFNCNRHMKKIHKQLTSSSTQEQALETTPIPQQPLCHGQESNVKRNPRTCNICQRKFSNEFNCERHMRKIHGENAQDSSPIPTTSEEPSTTASSSNFTPAKTRSGNVSTSFGDVFFKQNKDNLVVQRLLKESNDKLSDQANARKARQEMKSKLAAENERCKQDQEHKRKQASTSSIHDLIAKRKRKRDIDERLYNPGQLPDCCSTKTNFKLICDDCILHGLNHHEPICSKIRSGDCPSRRHQDYQKGGKTRRNLDYQIHSMRVFSDEAHEVAENWLRRKFCRNGNQRALDYCLRVLQMELFIRIFMDFKGCSYDEAEEHMVSNTNINQ